MTTPDRPTPERIEAIRQRADSTSDYEIAFSGCDAGSLLAEIDALRADLAEARRIIAADDARLFAAGQRVGIIGGCDTPDDMADAIDALREQITADAHSYRCALAAVSEMRDKAIAERDAALADAGVLAVTLHRVVSTGSSVRVIDTAVAAALSRHGGGA